MKKLKRMPMLCLAVAVLVGMNHVASARERDADAAKLAAEGKSPDTQPKPKPRGYLDFTKGDRIPHHGTAGNVVARRIPGRPDQEGGFRHDEEEAKVLI